MIDRASQHEFLTTPERWLICGCVALCYGCLAVLHRLGLIFSCKARTRHRLAAMAGMLLLAIAGASLRPTLIMGSIAIVGILQVCLDLYQGKPAPEVSSEASPA